MRMLWCWRCKAEMPMLDEEEFAQVADLHRDGLRAVKALRETGGAPLEAISMEVHFTSMLDRYEAITGYRETNPNTVWHHRLSLYGPPCTNCGRPLRTPKAKLCGSCMVPRA
jgi:hypothetical protein